MASEPSVENVNPNPTDTTDSVGIAPLTPEQTTGNLTKVGVSAALDENQAEVETLKAHLAFEAENRNKNGNGNASVDAGTPPPAPNSVVTVTGSTTPFVKAVFIGLNHKRGRSYSMPGVWPERYPVDKNWELLTPPADMTPQQQAFWNPQNDKNFSHFTPRMVSPGDLVELPAFLPEQYLYAVNSCQFAEESYHGQINKDYDDGLSSLEVYNKIKLAGGLVKPLPGQIPAYLDPTVEPALANTLIKKGG